MGFSDQQREEVRADIKKYGTEAKVKASALASFVITLIGTSWLGAISTDYVPSLPDVLEAPAYALIAAGVTFLAGYGKRNAEGKISPSTYAAVEAYLRRRNVLR